MVTTHAAARASAREEELPYLSPGVGLVVIGTANGYQAAFPDDASSPTIGLGTIGYPPSLPWHYGSGD